MPIDEPDRDELLKQAAVKVLLMALVVAAVVGIGTWILVKGLGLNDTGPAGNVGAVEPVKPLPSSALPVPSDSVPGGGGEPSPSAPTTSKTGLNLSASPQQVRPMQRINLTGSWAGQDNVSLAVQRLEGGKWTDFGVQVSVDVGTFATYVMTGHTGPNVFRVFDPASGTASNQVTVTVG